MNRLPIHALAALPLAWAVPATARADADDPARCMTMYEGWGMSAWPHVIAHGLLSLALFAMLIAVLFRLVRGPRRWRSAGGMGWHEADMPPWADRSRSALRILNERFARGEIDRPEFEERRAALMKDM